MQIHVPSVPPPLRITSRMWEDFLCDPVLAAWVLLGVKLDAFQACRLRYMWWTQMLIDSSGVGSGKTIVDFVFLALRCVLIPDQRALIFYPSFGTGKNEFWNYFTDFKQSEKAKIFVAQLGNPIHLEAGEEVAGDGTTHGPDCYTAHFRTGGWLKMPAPNIALDSRNAASLSANTVVIEEWAQIDAASNAIDKQLLDRGRRASWNQHHSIWGNHIVLTAHAQTRVHPAAPRYYAHDRVIKSGDPSYANISYSYKDFSDLPSDMPGKSFKEHRRNDISIKSKMSSGSTPAEKMSQLFGIWGVSGVGWFTEEAMLAAVERGKTSGLLPVLNAPQYAELQRN